MTEPTDEEIAREIALKTFKPRPLCRDCADVDGVCPMDGRKCDPKEQLSDVILSALRSARLAERERCARRGGCQ